MSRSRGERTGYEPIVSTLTVDMTACERDWFDQMRAAIACTSDANLVRIALWKMARHLDLDCGVDVFACRTSHAAGVANRTETLRLRRLQRRMRTA